jgi:membrane-bound ClpP family serine protease
MMWWKQFVFAAIVGIGWTGVLLEFVRPGWVVPGAVGGVALVYGLSRLLPGHGWFAIGISTPFFAIAAWMIAIGLRARRNKRAL